MKFGPNRSTFLNVRRQKNRSQKSICNVVAVILENWYAVITSSPVV